MPHKTTLAIILILLFMAALATVAWFGFFAGMTMSENEIQGTVLGKTKSIEPFSLIDDKQQPFTLENLKDKWSILYFGYTRCPDNCPSTLTTLKLVHDLLSAHLAEPHQVIFVSVDPERDTPEKLDKYLGNYDDDFTGVTGSAAELEKFAGNIGVHFSKTAHPSDSVDYRIEHSTSLILVDPEARMTTILIAPHRVGDLHNDIVTIIEDSRSR